MRYLTDIVIEQAIAHHLDHLMPEKVISKRALRLTEELHVYLREHIVAVSRMGSLVPAKFKEPAGEVAEACRAILSGEGKFVTQSARIAEKLFDAMGTNKSYSPGLLVVTMVRAEKDERFVALLKMEAQPVFKEERRQGGEGETYIELAIDPVALPAPGRHLQKCALIAAEHTSANPEILLIDKQARESAVAGFFHEHFLQAEYCRDSHFRTKKFVREFVKWANRARQEHRISSEDLDKSLLEARKAMRHDTVSVPEVIAKAIPNRGEQHDCLETLAKRQVDPKFETEPKASERFRKVQTIKLDHQAVLRLPQASTLDKEFYRVEPDPDDPTVSVIIVRSRKYQVS
ncbi:MAG: nucleoid-associated protein [Verrucomicrobiae bacterium]|nr:nucleoid-associated protein [Verrucomicrobiae bacterium]